MRPKKKSTIISTINKSNDIMTAIERYINEIKEAAKFLEQNPDWTPEFGWAQELDRKSPAQAIGEIVEELSWD